MLLLYLSTQYTLLSFQVLVSPPPTCNNIRSCYHLQSNYQGLFTNTFVLDSTTPTQSLNNTTQREK